MAKKVMKKAQDGYALDRKKLDLEVKKYKSNRDKAAADSVRAKANEAAPKPKPKKSIYSLYDSPSFAPTGPRPKKKNGGAIVKTKKK